MTAVMASTNRDRSTIDLAGVETGANIFVGLIGGAGAATAVAANEKTTMNIVGSFCSNVQCTAFALDRRSMFSWFPPIHSSYAFDVVSCPAKMPVRASRLPGPQ